jgi:hypothetical protein
MDEEQTYGYSVHLSVFSSSPDRQGFTNPVYDKIAEFIDIGFKKTFNKSVSIFCSFAGVKSLFVVVNPTDITPTFNLMRFATLVIIFSISTPCNYPIVVWSCD